MSIPGSAAPLLLTSAAEAAAAGAENSLRFDATASSYLFRSPSNESNRRTWTWSAWVKRTTVYSDAHLMMGSTDLSNWTAILFDFNRLGVTNSVSGTISYRLTSDLRFRDPSAWQHIVVAVDTTQGTATDRIKIYVNGDLLDSSYFSSHNWLPTQNQDLFINAAGPHRVGSYIPNPSSYGHDGYLADINLVDGQQLAPTNFGEVDATTGAWNPLSDLSSLTYGTNGFRLNFDNTGSLAVLGNDSSGQGNHFDAVNFTPLGVTAANTGTISTVALESQAVSTFKNRRGGGSNQGAPNNSWASAINMGDQVINVGSKFNPSASGVVNWNSDAWLYFELDTASAVTIGLSSVSSAQEAVLYGSSNGGSTWNFIAREVNKGRRITSTTAYQYYAYANPGQNVAANDFTILPAKTVLTLASSQDLDKIYENDFVQQDSSQTLSSDTISGFARLDYQNGASFGGNTNTLANAFRPEYNSVPPWQPGQQSVTATFTNLGLYATSIGVWCTWSNNASGWNVDGSTLTVNGTNVSSTATAVQKPISGWAGSAFLVTHTFSTPTLLTTVTAYCANASNYISGYYINGVKLVKGDTKLTLTGSTNLSNFATGDTVYQDNASTGSTYSSSLTATTGGSSTTITNPGRLYDGDLGNYPQVYGSGTTNIITHTTTLTNVQRLEIYLEVGNPISEVYVNGVGPHTNTGDGWNDLGSLIPGNGTVTSIAVHEYYAGSSYFPRVYGIRVNGQILLDNDQVPNGTVLASSPSGNQLLLSGTGGSWDSSSTQTADVTKAAGTGYVFDVDSGTNTVKLVNVANTWAAGASKYIVGPSTYTTNKNVDTLTDHPRAAGSDTGIGGEVSGNYCTWNPLDKGSGVTASNGNMEASCATTGINGTLALPGSGKYYFEVKYDSIGSDADTFAGLMYLDQASSVRDLTAGGTRLIVRANAGVIYNDSSTTATTAFSAGDVLGVAVDCGANSVQFYRNGSTIGSAQTPSTAINGANWAPWCGTSSSTSQFFLNAGQRPFNTPAPAGYKALCTANFDPPTIEDPSTVMDVALYTGNSSTQSITLPGTGFNPDLVWIKNRSSTYEHLLFDAVRGATKYIKSNSTVYEQTNASTLTSFDSSGFSLGGDNEINRSAYTYVGWCWDAGDTTTPITAGSLTSSLYDQSQTWSNSLTSSTGFRSAPETATSAFDGDTSTIASAVDNGVITFTSPVTFASSSTIRVIVHGGTHNVSVNGGSNQVISAGSFVTLNFTNPSASTFTITFQRTTTADTGVRAIEIGGKLLVDSGVSLSVPSIASSVRANTSAGFSIVTFGPGAQGDTVGHGLGVAPDLIIVKQTDAGSHWPVYHSALGNNNAVYLNLTNAAVAGNYYWNSTDPTSSVFTIGPDGDVKDDNKVAYCWAAVEGYSAFGSYTGNGSSSSPPFIFTSFRPRWVLIKSSSNAVDWIVLDTARSTYNGMRDTLYPNLSDAEYSSYEMLDVYSNGFAPRAAFTNINASGYTYVYAAFAESPFAYARAR